MTAFVPGGDVWLGEQGGTILDYHNGTVQQTPVVTLPNTYSQGECGLLGIALDPNFASNGYVYISYVVSVTNKSGVTQPFTRLSRFTYSGGTIDPATEKVYYQGNQTQNLHHPGNDLQIGPDGKLWWSVGDNVPAITNGEALSNIYGKMLRFNLDGTVPASNPFVNIPGAVPAIYAYGLRNPFRFTFLPTGQAMAENTGSSYWEDLDTIQPGGTTAGTTSRATASAAATSTPRTRTATTRSTAPPRRSPRTRAPPSRRPTTTWSSSVTTTAATSRR